MNILSECNIQDVSTCLLENRGNSSDENDTPIHRTRKRLEQFSDSDTEKENFSSQTYNKNDSETEDTLIKISSPISKSRIQIGADSSDSELDEKNEVTNEQKSRINTKRRKMKQKFQNLLASRSKTIPIQSLDGDKSDGSISGASDNEKSSIAKIKQKIRKIMPIMTTICDPDTSDEESNMTNKVPPKKMYKDLHKSTKIIEAKPLKMTAKQAMENMQLIKSESNRMLREKAVTLPYHRPKALTLKDIMSRRKPAVNSDGKVLPIKMNEEQLRQYALHLAQRQKEMMELCKSESDEDIVENSEELNIQESGHLEKNHDNCNVEIEVTCKNIEIGSSEELPQIMNAETINLSNQNDSNIGMQLCCNNVAIAETIVLESNEAMNESNSELRAAENKIILNVLADDQHFKDCSEENTQLTDCTETNRKQYIVNNNEFTNNDTNSAQLIIESEVNLSEDKNGLEQYSEKDSQSINLHYTETDTEKTKETDITDSKQSDKPSVCSPEMGVDTSDKNDFLSDDDFNIADIDKMIENTEILKDNENIVSTSNSIKNTLKMKPKLTGSPGMLIDLDGNNPVIPKRSGVELLKEKFTYFSKLKTPEELEREREKKLKPGAQHLKLKQELEEKIAAQRSLEWAKRIEEEKQQHQEIDAILDDVEEPDDSIDKIKSKLNKDDLQEESSSECEDELIEFDVEIKDKPRRKNPMLDDEAEESDIDEQIPPKDVTMQNNDEGAADDEENDNVGEESDEENNEDSSEGEETSESEGENEMGRCRKGRILRAFEDSDDEDVNKHDESKIYDTTKNKEKVEYISQEIKCNKKNVVSNREVLGSSEDDVIQLAQRHASVSEDLFTSQESAMNEDNIDVPTQSFSISNAKPNDYLCPSQPYHDPSLKDIADGFSQKLLESQMQPSQSQSIGEDILAMCTGQFYDNEFVSQSNEIHNDELKSQISNSKGNDVNVDNINDSFENKVDNINENNKQTPNMENVPEDQNNYQVTNNNHIEVNVNSNLDNTHDKKSNDSGHLLKSILDELDNPEFDKPKANKYFTGGQSKNDAVDNSQMKKRFIIDSDDEIDEENVDVKIKKKKGKKKRLAERALQFSDEEEEEEELAEEDYESEIEDDTEKVVDYDSEENEIVVKPTEVKKKKQATDFFEQEAELTSEDEWVGSGDEDEYGLDRMEREEGDDEVFQEGKLRKELGQIHMRDVLDQDKREVRLLQELLFEDGDLGDGHRQRKFRWRNAGDEETGTVPDELTDTQEEEFESEEQWRKQRHEREVFLRQMQKQDEDESTVNVTVNRTTIIKANLSSKSMSTLLMEANQSKISETTTVVEKKSVNEVTSPKKTTFSILKQNYHGSLLTRGRGALGRLAALATPLAVDDDTPKIGSLAPHKRNFVFAALAQEEKPPKVTVKRKAAVSTPRLVKKMKIAEKQNPKTSLLDHFNV